MGMVGLRDVYVVAPAASFHHHHHHQQQHHHQHQHQHPHNNNQESLFSSAEHPIIPLLSAAPCLVDQDPHTHHDSRSKSATTTTTGINLWQQPQQNPNPNPNPNNNPYLKKSFAMLDTAGILTTSSGGSAGTITCQDCGNQAKKDCSHRRCRTCCKSRGFDCSTHVKSTWVPAARRRERQLSASGGAPAAGSSASTSASKKPRLLSSQPTTSHTSTSNTTRSFDTSSSHQDASFRESLPGQVKAPAVFKCVRVTSVEDEGEDEYAYQAMVKIGGHVFKGFLYDQGEENGENNSNNTSNNAILNMSELHLGGASTSGGGARNGSASEAMVPSDIYGSGGGGLLGGTNYGNPIN